MFAISVFGTTLPHIFYGERLLNHKNAMQGHGQAVAQFHNKTDFPLGLDNSTNSLASDLSMNLCRNPELHDIFTKQSLKSEWRK